MVTVKKPGNEDTIVRFGPKGGETEIFKKDGSGLLKSFTDRFKQALGPRTEDPLAEENKEIREEKQRLKEAEKKTERGGKACLRKGKSNKRCAKPLGSN